MTGSHPPVYKTSLYKDDAIAIKKGKDKLTMYNCGGTSQEDRYFCSECSGKIYTTLNHLECSAACRI